MQIFMTRSMANSRSSCMFHVILSNWLPLPGAHFINYFTVVIQILWKFHSAAIKIVMKWSLWNFSLGMTAVLSWHVKNFVAI